MAFGHFHFHWGSHNFMVTALGSCVKWPLDDSGNACGKGDLEKQMTKGA